jgi:hypothetical protein
MIDVAPSHPSPSASISRPTAPGSGSAPAATISLPTLLNALTAAYAAGDAPRGEQLLLKALDEQLPWDVVCAAAARGVAEHHGEHSRA